MTSRRRGVGVVCALALLAAACGGDNSSSDDDPSPQPAEQADQGDPKAPAATEADSPTDELAGVEVVERDVRFATEDGEELDGTLFGEGDIGIVLAHMRGRDQSTWAEFARTAAIEGYQVLTFDFRGYGTSTGVKDSNLDVDLIAAINLARVSGVSEVVVMGASMGATASINVASRLDLAGAASLSAPAEFIGLDALDVAGEVAEPLLVITAENDQPYADTALELDQQASSSQLHVLQGRAHGTNLFADHGPELTQVLLDFVATVT